MVPWEFAARRTFAFFFQQTELTKGEASSYSSGLCGRWMCEERERSLMNIKVRNGEVSWNLLEGIVEMCKKPNVLEVLCNNSKPSCFHFHNKYTPL
jgi:hypothetical protein